MKGTDIQKDCEALRASIQYPKLLYRYRPVTTNSLNAYPVEEDGLVE